MKILRIHNEIYEIDGKNHEMIEELNLSLGMIRRRLLNNWTLDEACQVPKGLKRKDLEYIKFAKEYEANTDGATADYRDEKLRSDKPHLFNETPQTHQEGKYAKYLWDSYKFKSAEVVK